MFGTYIIMLYSQSPIGKYFSHLFYREVSGLTTMSKDQLYNHYIRTGYKQNLNPSIYFNTKWYAATYKIPISICPLLHFMANKNKGFKPNEKCRSLVHTGIITLPWTNITSEFVPLVTAPRSVNIILPGPGLTAGPLTLYAFANLLANKGLNVRIIIMYYPVVWQEYVQKIRERMEWHPSIGIVSMYENDVTISYDDLFVVSAWWTVYPLQFILDYLKNKKFFWFIQEMELIFHEGNEAYSKALECYNMDYYSFVHCSPLLDYLKETKFMRFKDEQYLKDSVVCFEPSVDRKFFYEEPKDGAMTKIIFYSRGNAPRNLSGIIRNLLINCIRNNIIDSRCQIIGFGDNDRIGKHKLTNGVFYQEVGFLDIHRYSQLLRSSHIAINLLLSPHTGVIPLEMACCGGLTIHNEYFTKNQETFARFTDKVLLSEPNQIDLMDNLKKAIYWTRHGLVRKDTPKNILSSWDLTLTPCY